MIQRERYQRRLLKPPKVNKRATDSLLRHANQLELIKVAQSSKKKGLILRGKIFYHSLKEEIYNFIDLK